MSYRAIDFNWLEWIIVPAIDLFYATLVDKDLINRDASEQAIAANIYCKMNKLFADMQAQNDLLQQLSIDAEYNRNFDGPKRAYEKCHMCNNQACFVKNEHFEETDMFPDILIHNRGTNNDNQVAIEFKKVSNQNARERRKDKAKLIYLTCQQPFPGQETKNYRYRYGFFIDLGIDDYSVTPFLNAHVQPNRFRQGGDWV